MPHSTTVASRCQSSFGLLAASHRSFVRSCRGGSRSCSAISPSPAGRGGHAVEPFTEARTNARRHRADACARSSRQVSARFRRTAGRTHHFPPAPLHFTAFSAVASAARTYISVPLRSDGRKLPRPSKTVVRPKIPEAAMLRISAKTGNMAARLRPARKSAIARDASHGQDTAIGREAPPGQYNRQ